MGFIAALSQRLSKIERQILDTSTESQIGASGALSNIDDMMMEEEDATSSNEASSDVLNNAPSAPHMHPPFGPPTNNMLETPATDSFMDMLDSQAQQQALLNEDGLPLMVTENTQVSFDPSWNAASSGQDFFSTTQPESEPLDCPLAGAGATLDTDCPLLQNGIVSDCPLAAASVPVDPLEPQKNLENNISFLSFADAPPVDPSNPSSSSLQGPLLKNDTFLFTQPTMMPEVSLELVGRSKSVNWTLLDAYFENVYPLIPIIPKLYFYEWAPMESDFLLNMMYAFGAKHTHSQAEANGYVEAAKASVLGAMSKPCLSSLHGLYLLAYYSASELSVSPCLICTHKDKNSA